MPTDIHLSGLPLLMFSLRKIAGLLLMPTGLLWMGLILATMSAWRRKHRGVSVVLFLLTAFYTVAGNIHVGMRILGRLENQIQPVDFTPLEPFDAVCVLGGGSDVNPAGVPELGLAGDRIMTAARLWHAGKARMLVASGVSLDKFNGLNRNGGEETRALWQSIGVPEKAILVVPNACWVTSDEIKTYCQLRDQYGWKRIALVSSAWHLPRALALAQKEGLRVTPIGSDWYGRRRSFGAQDWIPQGTGFFYTQLGCWEYLGQLMNRRSIKAEIPKPEIPKPEVSIEVKGIKLKK